MTIIEKIEKLETAMTVKEFGAMLGVSPKTLYAAVKAGRVPVMRVGGSIRIDPAEAADYLRERSTK
jgi:excisionase family DNA binding protein